MNETLAKIARKLKDELDIKRYDHTIGVMHTAGCLAMRYGESLDRALLAGLLHDCAKCIPHTEKIKLCRKNDINISETELKNPGLLHAKVGALLASKKYHVNDEEILQAITFHTTGRPAMTLLEKIIYIADYIEPGRDMAPNLPKVRELAFKDIEECLYVILKDSLDYLKNRGIPLDPMTENTFMYYNGLKDKTDK